MMHIIPWANFSKKSKSKTPEPHRPCTNSATGNHITQPTSYCTYEPPVQVSNFQQQQVYPHHQPMNMPISTCLHQSLFQPQQQIIHSPQQSVTCQQMRTSAVFDSRQNGMVMNSQAQLQPAHQYFAAPTLTSNQIHPTINGQTPRTTDNPYYSNQTETLVMQQHQQQQHHQHHQHQQQHQQHHNQFQQSMQQHNQNFQTQQVHQQQDPQRTKLQHQQQQHSQPQFQQITQHHPQHAPQFDLQRQRQQHHSQVVNSQYQQYQNHNQIATELANNRSMNSTTNETKELSIEVLCLIHDKGWEELTKMADELKGDLKELTDELEVIRRETPIYCVNEAQI